MVSNNIYTNHFNHHLSSLFQLIIRLIKLFVAYKSHSNLISSTQAHSQFIVTYFSVSSSLSGLLLPIKVCSSPDSSTQIYFQLIVTYFSLSSSLSDVLLPMKLTLA